MRACGNVMILFPVPMVTFMASSFFVMGRSLVQTRRSTGDVKGRLSSSHVSNIVGGGSDVIGDTDDADDGYAAYCETETFHATCALDEVIVMTRALYGRMRISRCVKLDYGHLGCVADVLELADARCSGRRRCEIRIPDPEFARNKPCPEDLKPYLEAGYKCIKVQTARDFCIYPRPTPVSTAVSGPTTSGFLASLVTELTGCGSVLTPWSVVVRPGQTIRVTLHDFAVAKQRSSSNHIRSQSSSSSSVSSVTLATPQNCPTYAVLREPAVQQLTVSGLSQGSAIASSSQSSSSSSPEPPFQKQRQPITTPRNAVTLTGTGSAAGGQQGGGKNVTICGGLARQSVVYMSVSNRIEIGFERGGDHLTFGAHYVIEYQAVGCADHPPIVNAVSIRNGDVLSVKCNYSSDIYKLTCKDGRWIGDRSNCSFGLSVLLVITIALIIGAFVLCGGLIVLNRGSICMVVVSIVYGLVHAVHFKRGRRRCYGCCTSDEVRLCDGVIGGTLIQDGDSSDPYGVHHVVASGAGSDLMRPTPLHPFATGNNEKPSHYATAALVRHLGGSMAVRAASQFYQWDLAGSNIAAAAVAAESVAGSSSDGTTYIYGVMRPSTESSCGTTTYGTTSSSVDAERSLRPTVSRLTTRVYPPNGDFVADGGRITVPTTAAATSSLYGRLPCGCCETYSSADRSAATFYHAATMCSTTSGGSRCRRQNRIPLDPDKAGAQATVGGSSDVVQQAASRRHQVAKSTANLQLVDGGGTNESQPEERGQALTTTSSSRLTIKTDRKPIERSSEQNSVSVPDAERSVSNEVVSTDRITPPMSSARYTVPELLSDCNPHGCNSGHLATISVQNSDTQ